MKGLYVDSQFHPESTFLHRDSTNKVIYKVPVLSKWHRDKPLIVCACQDDDPRAKMHVRRTPSGGYTLANNKEQSDKHALSCPFYGEVLYSISSRESIREYNTERVGDKLIVRLSLFPTQSEKKEEEDETELEAVEVGDLTEEEPGAIEDGDQDAEAEEEVNTRKRSSTFAEMIYDWYKLAVESAEQAGKTLSRKEILFYMWKCLIDHRIFIGKKDFYYIGYIPNPRFNAIRQKKVIVGFVQTIEERGDGQVWTIEGWKGEQMRVFVKNRHIPKYHTLNKLAALRVDCDEEIPITLGPIAAWRITKQGWFLFNDAEWEVLRSLEKANLQVERPVLTETEHYGCRSSFFVPAHDDRKPLLIDIMDMPSARMQRYNRVLDEDLFHESRLANDLEYVSWRSGDSLDFIRSGSKSP